MRRFLLFACCALLFAALAGCAYVDTRGPYDRDLDNTELGNRVGRSHNYSLLWLFAWGDGSYAAAAQAGEISVMKHADVEVFSVLFGLYVRRTIVVYGD